MSIRKALLLSAPFLLLSSTVFSAGRQGQADAWVEASVVWRSGTVSVKELANMPRLIGSPAVPYPEVARQARVGGPVCLEVKLNQQGRVAKVNAVSGPAMLRVFAEHAVRNWRYTPAKADGRPVEATGYVVLNFTLDQ